MHVVPDSFRMFWGKNLINDKRILKTQFYYKGRQVFENTIPNISLEAYHELYQWLEEIIGINNDESTPLVFVLVDLENLLEDKIKRIT